ncbi:MAG TPA: family 16 glycoside hydrolase [Candidatus Limnocylindria bacterium]|nr:family 16 glycoside hydrolase [Candidatus Limnocylindria bacterium]
MPQPHRLAAIFCAFFTLLSPAGAQSGPATTPKSISLFDGKTLDGWEGKPGLWRVENGVIIGGSLKETVKENEFLATTRRFTNFVFRTKFKLTGTGFVNSGVQMRSERVPGSSEMAGYQCDLGDPNWWGSLYDESRRNKTLAWSDMASLEKRLKRNDWNDYVIRADGNHITTWLNGIVGVDYFEPDESIIGSGKLGFQVHGGGATEASFKDITIEELPVQPKLRGAAEPPAPPHDSPLSPDEEQTTFSLPPGFQIELVAAEPDGGKFVALDFDHAGRMWTMTALEYPVDANEAGAEAKALFARGGRDRVLIFDTPTAPGRQKAHTFADGLVMPLGLLPYKDGAYVQYGTDIRFYRDTNGDGKADGYTNVLTGFGIEDSHLFPHQFTRAPGGWLWLAQGAFNYSKVTTPSHEVTEFNKTKMARWRPDGSKFETIGWGPCNIWGLVIDRFGEAFIQEANDQGWPMMPFLESASYPLCGDDVPKPYAPPFPKTGEKEMGGTGLSGLALSEGSDSFPGEWRDVFFLNNPITRKVQAIRVHRGVDPLGTRNSPLETPGNGWQLEHLPDFVLSSDPWFRPVAMTFGPDGCLYVVDWYNKIISHNEVPRNHPERDKTRGRVWRIRHESQPHRTTVPNLYKAGDTELLASLKAVNTWEINAAWQEIIDRQTVSLAPALGKLLTDKAQPTDLRIRALWCLEGLGQLEWSQIEKLANSDGPMSRAARKEALRAAQSPKFRERDVARLATAHLGDADRLVRQEAIRALASLLERPTPAGQSYPPLAGALLTAASSPPGTGGSKYRDYFDAFETYLVRRSLERHTNVLDSWFATSGNLLPEENQRAYALAAVIMGGAKGAQALAKIVPSLKRPLSTEEVVLLAGAAGDAQVQATLKTLLASETNLRLIYERRARLKDQAALVPLLTEAVRALVAHDSSEANHALLAQLATGFHLTGLETELVTAATRPDAKPDAQIAALRALRESGSTRVDVFRQLVGSGNELVRREAIAGLAASKSDAAISALLEVWPSLTPTLRKTVVDRLASSAVSAKQLVAAIAAGSIARDELEGYTLDKLATVLPDDATVKKLVAELGSALKPLLRLAGGDGDYLDAELTLDGPFTLECWVKLAPGINNEDSLLGNPAGLDANFYDSRFRVWVAGVNDIIVATKPVAVDSWTHLALTRDAEGTFRLFFNGELNATSTMKEPRKFEKLTPFRSNPAGGTAGDFAEYRVWNVCRSPDDIRAGANLALPAGTPGLVFLGSGESWGKLHGGAKLERTADLPPVQTPEEAKSLDAKFGQFRALAAQAGDRTRGQQVFTATCGVCHTVKGSGGKIGPVLDGAGASGVEALLRNVITPNAAMEAGYRRFRVETKDGDVLEGLLAAQDADSVTLRQPNTEDQRLLRANLKRAGFQRISIMPEGLLESLPPTQVSDLFAYLMTLK